MTKLLLITDKNQEKYFKTLMQFTINVLLMDTHCVHVLTCTTVYMYLHVHVAVYSFLVKFSLYN